MTTRSGVGRTYYASGSLSSVKSPLKSVVGGVGTLWLALMHEANSRFLDHRLDGWLERRMRRKMRRFRAQQWSLGGRAHPLSDRPDVPLCSVDVLVAKEK